MSIKKYDLTNAQNSILSTEQFYSNTNINNICGTAIISNKLNFEILEQAIINIIKNNDNFHIRFIKDNNTIKQYFTKSYPKKIEIINLYTKNELSELENSTLSNVFNITKDSNFEFKIFRFPDNTGGFLLNIHHLLADSWTLGLTCRKIIKEYTNLLSSVTTENSINKQSYLNHIENEKLYINSNKYKKDKEYWENIFSTTPNIVTIPSNNNINVNFSCNGSRSLFVIPKKQVLQIHKFCKNNNISVFNFFMATLAIYLYKINQTDDFVIGTPILNRASFDEKNTNGMFVNIAPLRIKLENFLDFKEFAQNIAINSMGLLRHQKYPYEKILEYVREKDNSIPNLYNIVLSYQITNAITENNIKYQTHWTFNGCSANDLDIQIFDLNETQNLNIAYDYKTEKYSTEEINTLHKRILNIISQILSNNNIQINNINILTNKEIKKILDLNKTKLYYNKQIPIINYFEKQASKNPNNIAISFKGTNLTYKELNEKSNSLAYYLRNIGVTNNTIVGIMQSRSLEMIISILAILKSGGAYLPIDPEYPVDRISYMLENSKTNYLLINNNQHKNIACKNIINVNLNNKLYLKNKNNLKNISSPDDLAYIIYTSGSTGKPKGVMLSQKNYSNFFAAMKKAIPYLKSGKNYSIVSITTVSFDIFAFETIISLANGLHLFLTDYFEQKYTNNLSKLIYNEKIDIIQTTPSIMRFHIDNENNLEHFANLKYIILAGEQLPKDLINKIKTISPKINIINGYGPSETTIFSSIAKINNPDLITIGKPIANTYFYILDKDMNLLPQNTVGEIYIAGDGVGKGYLFQQSLTDEKFLPNPFKTGIMYKTGDLGLWNNNGNLECKGRIDHQVKINGLRIELGEIENVINNFANKTQSVVVYKKNNNTNTTSLHAFISSPKKINIDSLKNYMLDCLPNYMIPSSYSFIKDFPTLPNGKINRKELKFDNITENNKEIILPTNTTEQTIYLAIKKLIPNSTFGITDDFFSIGLDSLKLINLSILLNNEFNTKLSISDFYHHTNIQKLSEFLNTIQNKEIFEIKHVENQTICPISSAQERIFYANKIANDTTYNVTGGILINKKINKNKIIEIFEILLKRHKIFRTTFIWNNNNLLQKILPYEAINIKFINNKTIDYQNLINDFAKPFTLQEKCLLRVEVHFSSKNETFILIDTHHIVVDGTSLSILIDELTHLLKNEKLPQLNIDYLDYALWENKFKNTKQFEINKTFWEDKFKNSEIPIINLPYDSKKELPIIDGKTIKYTIPEKDFKNIIILAKKYNTSPYLFLLSAFYILLYKYTGQENIIIGSPFSAREMPNIQNMIGMFVNNLILQNHLTQDMKFSELINNTRQMFFESMEHEPYPYEMLCRKFNTNFFDILFTYQNKFDFLTNDYQIYTPNNKPAKFNLSFEIIEATHTINVEYKTSLFNDTIIQNLLNNYITLLYNIIDNSEQTISNLSILTKDEENKLIYGLNNTFLEYPKDITFIKLFEEQVEKTPDRIAIIFENSFLTFNELNEKSNILAHYLRNSNIKPNDIIGIMLNRSLDLIIHILAVLKSGASYIPIDPTYPKQRINYMLSNSQAKMLLVNSETCEKVQFDNKICINLDQINTLSNKKDNLNNITSPEDNSYIIYTSGSTGTPKGVVLNQKALVNLTYYLNNYVEFLKNPKETDCMGSVTTASFDIFVFESLICLQKGIRVAIANKDEQIIPKKFNSFIIKNKVNAIQMTPSRMQLFIDNINDIPEFNRLKYIILAGEPLPTSLVSKLKSLGAKKIYNGYGPSETTIFSTFTDVTNYEKVNIGKPLSNTFMYILDTALKPVPFGTIGELFISGDGVGKGYINKPNITKASFINNPFLENSTMYKTGDLCKFLSNGEISYIGRADNQIKIRGLRITLDEIENTILKFPFIEKVKVIKQNIKSREFISAYYIASKRINISNLKSYLLEFLPNYMIPTYFTALDEFPYTPNGKINKNDLPLPNTELNNLQENYTPPKTDLEIQLVKLFEDVLNIKPIGINDNFFILGGDSISAMKLNIELSNISKNIKYSDIFTHPTIVQLISLINKNNIKQNENSFSYLNINSYENILKNNLILPNNIKKRNLTNVLLTGATGFLGMHILDNLLINTNSTIYCLIKKEPGISINDKFINKLNYYWGDKHKHSVGTRIQLIEGDITNIDLTPYKDNINVIINSAAKVSHYGKTEDFYNINIKAVQNLLNFSHKYNKQFYQISSLSVSGNTIVDDFATYQDIKNNTEFKENNFYINQSLTNVYVKSKFEAEELVLKAIENGQEAYILRVGNLMPRYTDGKFQENINENAYLNRLLAFTKLKILPESLKNIYLEFTPIDYTADAIVRIITHPSKNNNIYHIFNNKHIDIEKILKILYNYNYDIKIINDDDFKQKIQNILKNTNEKNILTHLINDFDQNFNLEYNSKIIINSDFTQKFLAKIGFTWPEIDENYIKYIISIIERL